MSGSRFNWLDFMDNTPHWLRVILAIPLFFLSVELFGRLADSLFIIFAFGLGAYLDGLRFVDSKHGVLSDGTEVSTLHEFIRIPLHAFLIFGFLILALLISDRLIGTLKSRFRGEGSE